MPRVWSATKPWHRTAGFSAVEALLAATLFGMLVAAIGGALVFARSSTGTAGDRQRAVALADEGIEAVRNIRDAAYSNLTDGTFGLVQSSNQWALSGSSDTNGIYTRQLTVASNGTTRKTVTSTVSWPQGGSTRQVSVTSQFTNWMAAVVKSWTNPSARGSLDISSTNDGIKVATQGNYAYLVRNDGTPDFAIINISNPASPTLVGSLSLTGVPTNIAVSGNYAYVTNTSDTGEMQIIDITTPSAPVLRSTFNALGNADGTGVAVSGSYAYLTRKANGGTNEFVVVNITNPALPVQTSNYGLNVNMNEVYFYNGTAYIATDSDTQEIVELGITLGVVLTSTSINLPGTANATTIDGFDNTLLVGQGTTFYTVDGGATNSVLGSVVLSGTINDIAYNTARTYAYIGTSATAAEFQVVSIGTLASPTLAGSSDISGTTSTLGGVAYNSTLDVVPGASASDTQELIIFGPG